MRVTEPFTPGGEAGWGLSTRYLHALAPGVALTVDSLVAVMSGGMAYSLGIGLGPDGVGAGNDRHGDRGRAR